MPASQRYGPTDDSRISAITMPSARPTTNPDSVYSTVFFSASVMTSGNICFAMLHCANWFFSRPQSAETAKAITAATKTTYWAPRERLRFCRRLSPCLFGWTRVSVSVMGQEAEGEAAEAVYGPIHFSYSFLYVPSALASEIALLTAASSLVLPF